MRSICETFEEAIWDHARTGDELSADVRAHIERCDACRQTLHEAKQIIQAVIEADVVPEAPDCRRAVMSRIAPPVKKPLFAWGYAYAGLAVAGLSAFIIANVYMHSSAVTPVAKLKAPRSMTAKSATEPKAAAVPEAPKQTENKIAYSLKRDNIVNNVSPDSTIGRSKLSPPPPPARPYMMAKLPGTRAAEDRIEAVSESDMGAKTDTASYTLSRTEVLDESSVGFEYDALGDDKELSASKASEFQMDMPLIGSLYAKASVAEAEIDRNIIARRGVSSAPIEKVTDEKDQPVAIAVVHWSAPTVESVDYYSYSYRDTDSVTGAVTNCSVTRNGDTVNITIESEPKIENPSKRGSIAYEILAKI